MLNKLTFAREKSVPNLRDLTGNLPPLSPMEKSNTLSTTSRETGLMPDNSASNGEVISLPLRTLKTTLKF